MEVEKDNCKSAMVKGINTNYYDCGEGVPVLLLHGSAPGVSAWANWAKTMSLLSKTHRVIAYDIPGFGYTERNPNIDLGMKLWVQHAIEFLNYLELEKVHIVGNSFGGALALAISIYSPEKTDKLVLMGSGGLSRPVSQGLHAVWQYQASVENMRSLLRGFVYDDSILSEELVQSRHDTSLLPNSGMAFDALRSSAFDREGTLMTGGIPEGQLAGIKNRVLILHGREDKIMPSDIGVELNQILENSELHIFGKCGHWVQIEQAAEFYRLVSNFLSQS